MNVFILHEDPITAARMHCDKHVPKMIVESAQMISTAHRMLDGHTIKKPSKSGKRIINYWEHPDPNDEELLYKAVHHNHPCTLWTRQTTGNYDWHYELFAELCKEFTKRFGKTHLSESLLLERLKKHPVKLPKGARTKFPLAMSNLPECMVEDPVQSYRNYYIAKQSYMPCDWNKGTPMPSWFKKLDVEGVDMFLQEKRYEQQYHQV
tara:strand:- start:9880 stop:10500 length:621 start_codon:yes stop_codon:yes gene_type:complete